MTTTASGFAPVARLGPNPAKGRDLVVGDVHGYFATLRHALAELEFGAGDRLFSLGDLIDRGPDSAEALSWIHGDDPAARFDLAVRGNHEQMMLDALAPETSAAPEPLRSTDRNLWYDNGGDWWMGRGPNDPDAAAWTAALAALPFAARIETVHGPIGLVHAGPVYRSWERLETALAGDGPDSGRARMRALWSRVWHRFPQPEIGESGREYAGPVAGVRAVVTGHTPVSEPVWRWNVLDIDTGIAFPHMRRLTVARIDTEDIVTRTFPATEYDMEVRDSFNSPLRIAEIPVGPGRIGLTICPGKQGPNAYGDFEWRRDLETDIAALREWGASLVLTLMESDELARYAVAVPMLRSALDRAGIGWRHFPIRDLSVPRGSPPEGWPGLSAKLRRHMAAGKRVLIHCRGGLGRTGLAAALLLIDNGEAAETAIRRVRAARPGAIETREQEEYVRRYRA